MKTLGEALPEEIKRVREEVLPHYESIPEGAVAAQLMRGDILIAEKAIAKGDVILQIQILEALKGWRV